MSINHASPDPQPLPVAILAGGLATRLRPITERIPKALVEVAGRPFIAWQLELLAGYGVREVVLCIGYLGEMLEAEVGDGAPYGLRVRYQYDGPRLLGTGGAIRQALPLLGEAFQVLYGDSYLPIDYAAVGRAFRESGQAGLMTVFHNRGQWDTSNVEFDPAAGRIVTYDKHHRTPAMEYIDYGLSAFRADVFAAYGDEPFDLARVQHELAARGELAGFVAPERFYEIGSHEGLAELDRKLASGT
jgi:MurNAc alpha-1-phosphate uridylyltransferase